MSEITDLRFAFHYEIEDLEKKLFQAETQVKALNEEVSTREDDYRNYNKNFTDKIKCLEVSFVALFIDLGKISDGCIGGACCTSFSSFASLSYAQT